MPVPTECLARPTLLINDAGGNAFGIDDKDPASKDGIGACIKVNEAHYAD
jgi:hypothetical protein